MMMFKLIPKLKKIRNTKEQIFFSAFVLCRPTSETHLSVFVLLLLLLDVLLLRLDVFFLLDLLDVFVLLPLQRFRFSFGERKNGFSAVL